MMRAQEKGAMGKTAIKAIKKALPGLAKKAGGKWEKKIVGMKTMFIESVELTEIFSRAQMKKAIGIARKSDGDYSGAVKQIEKIAKGLSDEHIIKNALKKANESDEMNHIIKDALKKVETVTESKVNIVDFKDSDFKTNSKKFNVAIATKRNGSALVVGDKKDIKKYLTGTGYKNLKKVFPELFESTEVNESSNSAITSAIEEGVSLSKKGDYEVTVDGKSSVGIRIGLRFKGKLISTGSKIKGEFVMGFKHHTPPKGDGFRLVKKGKKFTHIGFSKVDSIIAYSKKLIK
jgi:hypothetical protein